MKVNKYLQLGTTVFACILGTCFLLLLVDKGHITGKITAMTTASVADFPTAYIGDLTMFMALIFITLTVVAFFHFKNKKKLSKK